MNYQSGANAPSLAGGNPLQPPKPPPPCLRHRGSRGQRLPPPLQGRGFLLRGLMPPAPPSKYHSLRHNKVAPCCSQGYRPATRYPSAQNHSLRHNKVAPCRSQGSNSRPATRYPSAQNHSLRHNKVAPCRSQGYRPAIRSRAAGLKVTLCSGAPRYARARWRVAPPGASLPLRWAGAQGPPVPRCVGPPRASVLKQDYYQLSKTLTCFGENTNVFLQ